MRNVLIAMCIVSMIGGFSYAGRPDQRVRVVDDRSQQGSAVEDANPVQGNLKSWELAQTIMDGADRTTATETGIPRPISYSQKSSDAWKAFERVDCRVEKRGATYFRHCRKEHLRMQKVQEFSTEGIPRSQFAKEYPSQTSSVGEYIGASVGMASGFLTGTVLALISGFKVLVAVWVGVLMMVPGLMAGAILGSFIGWLVGKAKVKSL